MAQLTEEAQFQVRRGELMLREREERRRMLRAEAEVIAAALKREFGATRVWLFGSVLRPWLNEGSDIDLAAEGVPAAQRGDAADRALELARAKVDLVFIEDASALLRDRILADGELLDPA